MKRMVYEKLVLLVALITKNASNAFQNPTQFLLQNCPNVQPFVNTPAFDGRPFDLSLSFQVDRLIGIDDLSESFSLIGSVGIQWNISCVANLTQNGLWPWHHAEFLQNLNAEDFWLPKITFRNSLTNALTGKDFNLQLVISSQGLFSAYYWGKFEVYCDLNFANFPMDK